MNLSKQSFSKQAIRLKDNVIYDNETEVYVVIHQPYVYGCGCGCEEDDYKNIMLGQASVKGVFESEALAKNWMHKEIRDGCEGDPEYMKHEKEMHWTIEPHNLSKFFGFLKSNQRL